MKSPGEEEADCSGFVPRRIFKDKLKKITEYARELGMNADVFTKAVEYIRSSEPKSKLNRIYNLRSRESDKGTVTAIVP